MLSCVKNSTPLFAVNASESESSGLDNALQNARIIARIIRLMLLLNIQGG